MARRTDGQTDIRPSVPSRAPSRGSRAGSLARCGSSLQLSLKRICGRRTLLPQQNQENNFRIKPSGTIKNEKKKKQKKTTNTTQSPNPKFKGTLQSQQLPAQPRSDVGFGTNLGPVAHPHGRTALHLAGPRVATGFARGFATGAPWCSGFRHCSHGCGMQEEGLRPVGLRALPSCLHVPLRFVYSKDKLFPY